MIMKPLFLSAVLLSRSLALEWGHEFSSELLAQENVHGLFQSWRFHHSKVYDSAEEEMHRFSNFHFNLQRIGASNDQYYAGEKSYLLRMNKFGDLTDEEFYETHNCPQTSGRMDVMTISVGQSEEKSIETPTKELKEGATVDWFEDGYAVPVKKQGECGSCWAFAATGAMECNYALEHNVRPPTLLSEQQLVDCAGYYDSDGCEGGSFTGAWEYAQASGGLCTEDSYRYTATDGFCKASACGQKFSKPMGFKSVRTKNEAALQEAVDEGCVAVGIEADQFAFTYYSRGILDSNCGSVLNHAVLAVGYGVLYGEEYWIVKNSWGDEWGVGGLVYICKNCGKNGSLGQCGILSDGYQVFE